jgi:hypothetical protein
VRDAVTVGKYLFGMQSCIHRDFIPLSNEENATVPFYAIFFEMFPKHGSTTLKGSRNTKNAPATAIHMELLPQWETT